MTTQEMIAVMQAAVDGKTIQHRVQGDRSSEWDDCLRPVWDWYHSEYRVNPEPRERWIVKDTAFRKYETAKERADAYGEAEIIHVREVLP